MLAYTAFDENDVRLKMQDHEFDGYCRKGTNFDCLVWLIGQLLVKKSSSHSVILTHTSVISEN